ncbi:endonuclease NucS domain-containing protein [Kocuria oceani]|uniref:endonuclease NucS domain-containing protein n=1 Tax=Kocuria oceani TaxID=988827 RepID=UPI0040351659
MSDVQLFRIHDGAATELEGSHALLEKHLQAVVENNMEVLFGVRFLRSEYRTGDRHGGRIDSLGVDENGSPVIFEYKRRTSENVINQGLYYLDWLMDHRAEFVQLVRESAHAELTDAIDWSAPRLICVATDFNRYDRHAVQQIDRAIDLVRYRDFGGELLTLDLVHTNQTESITAAARRSTRAIPDGPLGESQGAAMDVSAAEDLEDAANSDGTGRSGLTEKLEKASPELREMFDVISDHFLTLGDDVSKKTLMHYVAFRRLKTFGSMMIRPGAGHVLVMLRLNPDTVQIVDGFTRDVRSTGHHGLGELEVRVSTADQLEDVYALIQRAYDNG